VQQDVRAPQPLRRDLALPQQHQELPTLVLAQVDDPFLV
jgi:hypothetical protein